MEGWHNRPATSSFPSPRTPFSRHGARNHLVEFARVCRSLRVRLSLGSIPFGVLLTRLAGVPDVRTIGSGNIGATNVLRTGRKALAAATLVGDMLKGAVPVLVVDHFFGEPWRCGGDRRISRPPVSGLARI